MYVLTAVRFATVLGCKDCTVVIGAAAGMVSHVSGNNGLERVYTRLSVLDLYRYIGISAVGMVGDVLGSGLDSVYIPFANFGDLHVHRHGRGGDVLALFRVVGSRGYIHVC